MNVEMWTSRWWEAAVVVLGVNSVVFGILFANSSHAGWGIAVGYVPGALLLAGLLLRARWPAVAMAMLIGGSLLAAVAWWVFYTVALAAVIVLGGFSAGKLVTRLAGPRTS